MNLPQDFTTTLAKVEQRGILNESPDQIRDRLMLALEGVAAVEGVRSKDFGLFDWAGKLLHQVEAAVYKELCDPKKGELKEAYQALLNKGLTSEGVQAVAAAVLKVVMTINPAYGVSSVAIYLAIWLLKVGLNYWCARPAPSVS